MHTRTHVQAIKDNDEAAMEELAEADQTEGGCIFDLEFIFDINIRIVYICCIEWFCCLLAVLYLVVDSNIAAHSPAKSVSRSMAQTQSVVCRLAATASPRHTCNALHRTALHWTHCTGHTARVHVSCGFRFHGNKVATTGCARDPESRGRSHARQVCAHVDAHMCAHVRAGVPSY